MVANFLFGDDSNIKEDTSFLESGILDSTGILELVGFLEETYEITVNDEELIPENLDSLKKVAAFVEKKIQSPNEEIAQNEVYEKEQL